MRILGVLMAACVLTATTANAAPQKLRSYGEFTPAAAKKAQTDVRNAMTRPMDELLTRATEISPEYLLDYGLALELGREPATRQMSDLQRQRVQTIFQDLLGQYIKAKDNIALKGTEPQLLEQADFWILLARSLAWLDAPPAIAVSDEATGTVTVTDTQTIVRGERQRYTLRGDRPVLDPKITSAAQTCAIYARVSARMQKVVTLERANDPNITPEQLKAFKAEAADILRQARTLGVDACAGAAFFDEVTAFAARHMGKLGTLPDEAAAN